MNGFSSPASNEPSDKELTLDNLIKNNIRISENSTRFMVNDVASFAADLLDFRQIITVDDVEQLSRHEVRGKPLQTIGNRPQRRLDPGF